MVQKGDLKVVSFRLAPNATGIVPTDSGAVPTGRRRYIYYLKVSSVGGTDAQFEMNQRFSNIATSDWRRDFTYVDANSVQQMPTKVDIERGPINIFDEETFIHTRCSGAEVDVTMVYADE